MKIIYTNLIIKRMIPGEDENGNLLLFKKTLGLFLCEDEKSIIWPGYEFDDAVGYMPFSEEIKNELIDMLSRNGIRIKDESNLKPLRYFWWRERDGTDSRKEFYEISYNDIEWGSLGEPFLKLRWVPGRKIYNTIRDSIL